MQNFILFIATLTAAWFVTLGINRVIFNNTNVNLMMRGNVKMVDTDIGNQCGANVNQNTLVNYKLTNEGRLVYLCPLGLWPIQTEVTAIIIPQAFRSQLSTSQAALLNKTYPEQKAPAAPIVQQPAESIMQTPAFH